MSSVKTLEVYHLTDPKNIILTNQELNNIFSWEPYRDDWPINRNAKDDNINVHYGDLIKSLTQNSSFDSHYSENGSLGNYLEFFCYPPTPGDYAGNAIIVCVSLCAPVAAYGQTTFYKSGSSVGWGNLFTPGSIYQITDSKLIDIEKEIRNILIESKLYFLDKKFAGNALPTEVAQRLKNENHNDGNQYLHGYFQKTD